MIDLGAFVRGGFVVQPRMGMADPVRMAAGLRAVREVPAPTVGTITIDSYTRIGDLAGAREALRRGDPLNGYPIAAHDVETTRRVVGAVEGAIPVQVRHGSARPGPIFRAMVEAGLSASEGGPVSYCLPYGRTPLAESVAHWDEATPRLVADCRSRGLRAHLETFGGCLLGQLCPPSLLIAVSVLESLYFAQRGVESLSLSYAQQTSAEQDAEALAALRSLADELLPSHVDRHLVLYTYMGVYPRSPEGANRVLDLSAELAVRGGAARLIVKTTSEAWRIPTIGENTDALTRAARRAASARPVVGPIDGRDVLAEARLLVEAVLGLSDDLGRALCSAFSTGLLDVPFCLHRDNRGESRAAIDASGRLRWTRLGQLPLPGSCVLDATPLRARELLDMLRFVAHSVDREPVTGATRSALPG